MKYRIGLFQLLIACAITGLLCANALVWAAPQPTADTTDIAAPADTAEPILVQDKAKARHKTKRVDQAKTKAPAKAAETSGDKGHADSASADHKTPVASKDDADDHQSKAEAKTQPSKPTEDPAIKKLKAQTQKLTLEDQAAAARLAAELRKAKEEIQRLKTQMELDSTRQKAQLAKLTRAKAELEARIDLGKAKITSELAGRELQIQRKAKEVELKNKELELSLADKQMQIKKIKADLAQQEALATAKLASKIRETQKLTAENENLAARMARQELDLKQKLAKTTIQMIKMKADLANAQQREQWQEQVIKPIQYTKTPFNKGKLIISDRRIELNGPIWDDTAKNVTERINFYNNQSTELPIFIVIDESPGGSVAAGAHILQAMASSKAPIHVVVKRFAASMAAVITTLAPHSYAYPNAIILHHQPSSSNAGNVTQQKEGLAMIEKWEKRFGGPVAKKMGLTLEQFRKQMYKHNSDGDWMTFADEAVKLKWVDHLVYDCHEQGIRKKPENATPNLFIFFHKEGESPIGKIQYDDQGVAYMKLPPLTNPFDVWYLYNPNRFYR